MPNYERDYIRGIIRFRTGKKIRIKTTEITEKINTFNSIFLVFLQVLCVLCGSV